jgi:hypothetical protein
LEQLAALPSIDILLGETLGILNLAMAKTPQLLTHHQQKLVGNLGQYVKDQE